VSEDPFAGAWQGAIQVAGVELEILLNVTGEGAGAYSATLDIPQQGATGIPVGNLAVTGGDVSFTILEEPQQATFAGTLEDETLSGVFSQAGQEGAFSLTRSSVADVEETSGAGEGAAGDSATGISSVYTSTTGAFSVPVPTNWVVEETGGIVTLTGPEGNIRVDLMTVPTDDPQAAIVTAWEQIDPDFALEIQQTVEPPATAGYERIVANVYNTGGNDRIVQAAAMLYNGMSYVMVYDLTLEAAQRRSAQLSIIDSGFRVLGMEQETISAEEMGALTPELIAEWEAFIEQAMATFDVPGAVVGVVQGDELIYSNAFGYADPATQTPMATDMQMMIGSTGKSLTTLMMATLVDDGLMTWDTAAQALLPEFAVKDPGLSETITMRNLVCACTGVPRRDLEFIFNWSELDAENVVASLQDFEFFTDFGEAFQYSNQMVATAGYISGHVAEPEVESLMEAYQAALAERVTGPIGMENTTLSLDEVQARGNHATPHGMLIEGGYEPLPLAYEQSLLPIGPAGGHWSTLEDMARYMVVQLNNGATADGTRVVSEENLLVTRVPQVKISAEASYGLGWMISDWRGLPMIEHGGNTLGFTSDFSFLPTADLGVIVLANAQGANTFTNAARMWLFQQLFGVENETEAMVTFFRSQMDDAQARLDEQLAGELDVAAVEPFVGSYRSPVLGALALTLDDGRLFVDIGEFVTELLPKVDDDGNPDGFLTADPPLPGFAVRLEMDGDSPTVILGEGLTEYTFTPTE
jgi:CubicO group peptidase (beta-lactamase class C family)